MITETYIRTRALAGFLILCSIIIIGSQASEKYKLCVVDGKAALQKTSRFCPVLDQPDSKVECVLGVDRLDCLRRISKGKADFSVFTPEDLVTASNSKIEVLVTNELRYTKDAYEYEVVVVVDNNAGIRSRHDLKDKRFCHPGYGYETDWTKIISNYFEASLVPQICQPQLTLTENRVKASSQFFRSACKAGPWVDNQTLDQELKHKYPNLCQLCFNPAKCSTQDKYWGTRGPLYCLTDGAGDLTWARWADVKAHFGLKPGRREVAPDGYSLLCPDDTVRPVNTSRPCVWVAKPWPVIASKRAIAQDIQAFMGSLGGFATQDSPWKSALMHLVEAYHLYITNLDALEAIESYLERAPGFLNANSFTGCHPPRTIRVCTTSVVENAKCSWLVESAAAYGIEPNLDCLKADNTTHCMQAINDDLVDVVMVPPHQLHIATARHRLKPLFYETVNDDGKYLTIAVTTNRWRAQHLGDLRGARACFPEYDGVAWNTALHALRAQGLIDACPLEEAMLAFFGGGGCAPGRPSANSTTGCEGVFYRGDYGAVRCLLRGKGDVAFLSRNALLSFLGDPNENKGGKLGLGDFGVVCGGGGGGCHLSWAPLGQAMVRQNATALWMKDALDAFLQLSDMLGQDYKSPTNPFQIFGPFDGKSNILFHDDTVRLRAVPTARNIDRMPRIYEELIKTNLTCTSSTSSSSPKLSYAILLSIVAQLLFIRLL